MVKLRKVFILLFIFFIVLASSCYGWYNKQDYTNEIIQFNEEYKLAFMLPLKVLQGIRKLPEYADYVKGTYEICVCQDCSLGGNSEWYIYFVSRDTKIYIDHNYNWQNLYMRSDKAPLVTYISTCGHNVNLFSERLKKLDNSSNISILLNGEWFSDKAITINDFTYPVFVGASTLPIYTNSSCKTVFFSEVDFQQTWHKRLFYLTFCL